MQKLNNVWQSILFVGDGNNKISYIWGLNVIDWVAITNNPSQNSGCKIVWYARG